MFIRIDGLGALALGCLLAACSATGGDDTTSGGAALRDESSSPSKKPPSTEPASTTSSSPLLPAGAAHAAAIQACLSHEDVAKNPSQPPDARIQAAEQEWQCFAGANGALVAAIEPVAKSSGALPAGAADVVTDYRASAHALCDRLTAVRSSWDLKKYACYGNREFDLAMLLGAYANVTSKPPANVWAAFGGDGTPLGPEPSRPVTDLEIGGTDLRDAILDSSIASNELCTIAEASYGPARVQAHDCTRDAQWLLYIELLLAAKNGDSSVRCWSLDELPAVCGPPT